MLRVLRQLRSKDGAGGGLGAVPCRVRPGHAARRSAWCCVLHNCREFTPDRIRRIRQLQRQKHQDGLDPCSFRSIICHSTNCATLPLWITVVLTQLSLYYTVLYTILYYTIPYYTILYYTILYSTILYYTILYYTILYYTVRHAGIFKRSQTWTGILEAERVNRKSKTTREPTNSQDQQSVHTIPWRIIDANQV